MWCCWCVWIVDGVEQKEMKRRYQNYYVVICACLHCLQTRTQIVISISSQAHVNFYTVQNAQLEITTHKHKLQSIYFLYNKIYLKHKFTKNCVLCCVHCVHIISMLILIWCNRIKVIRWLLAHKQMYNFKIFFCSAKNKFLQTTPSILYYKK